MSGTTDRVGKVVYRAVMQSARRFDRCPSSKVLIHRYGIEVAAPEELGADKRLYAAGVEAFTGQRFAGAERVKWPLQRLVHNLSRQEYINTHHGKDDDTKSNDAQHKSETTSGTRGPVYGAAAAVEGYKAHPEVDASVERALRKFFPPELKEVEVDDMYSAGFAALRELSSKWALAQTLKLDEHTPRTWRRPRRSAMAMHSIGWSRRKRRTLARSRRSRRMQEASSQTQHSPRPPHPSSESSSVPPPSSPLPEESAQAESQSTEQRPGTTENESGSTTDRVDPEPPQTGFWGPIPRGVLGSGKRPLFGVPIEPTVVPAKGVYLLSHPLLGVDPPAPIFHRSVVLLVEHTEKMSYGLVVNKGRDVTLRDVVRPEVLPLASETFNKCFANNSVRLGGPVMTSLSWLHRYEEVGGVPVADRSTANPVFFCGDLTKASELVENGHSHPEEFSIFMGASTWDGNKLAQELAAGDWIMAKAPSTLALSTRHNLWEEMLQAMGGEYAEMSRLPPVGRWKELGVENHPCDFPL